MNKLEKNYIGCPVPPKNSVYTGVNRQYTGLFKPEIPPLPYVAGFLGRPCIFNNIYVYICIYM